MSNFPFKNIRVCCITCQREDLEASPDPRVKLCGRTFIVCPNCGNKRCPKATQHDLECTGSNAVGQKGSDWENCT